MSNLRHTSRTDDLVVQETGDELLVYDQRTDIAHCLTAVAATVWRECDGGADFDAIVSAVAATGTGGDAETLALKALDELADKQLLEAAGADPSTLSRRQALRKLAGAGMVAAAAPLVVSATVTTPAQAQSPSVCRTLTQTCTGTNNTAGNCCQTPTALICTRGTASTGQQYCATSSTCIGPGQKPRDPTDASKTVNCSALTASQCCSGMCGTTQSTQNNCA